MNRGDAPCSKESQMTTLELDDVEARTLRDILEHQLPLLLVESARTDAHDFREMLNQRRRVIEHVLDRLQPR